MKLKIAILPALSLAIVLLGSTPDAKAVEGAPTFVDYQGLAYDPSGTALGSSSGGTVASPTNYTMQFKIYDSQSATTGLIWAETQTVTVSLGQFSVRLGQGAAIPGLSPVPLTGAQISSAFNNGKDRYLEVTVVLSGGTGTPILPRLAFQTSPFSFVSERAKRADSVGSDTPGTVIANGAGSSFTGTVNVTGSGSSFSGATISGGTFSGGTFSGNGAGLTGLTAGQIPSLDAGKISSGIFATARIPSLDAGKITSGVLPIARGGTGSGAQNFVDTSSQQTYIVGNKSFYNYVAINGNATTVPRQALDVFGNAIISGKVGIGTTTPNAPLDVRGSSPITQNYAWFIRGAGTNSVQTGVSNNLQYYSIVAEQSISAHQFCSTSDARIKDGVVASDIRQDLATIQQLRVKDYRMVDKVGLGNGLKKGFIAQEVEQVIPEAVTMGTEFVPDVYALASSVKWNATNQNLALTMPKAHGLNVGDRVRLSADDTTLVLNVVSVPSALEVVLGKCEKEVELVFVFGKQVLDFRTVNYDRIFTTGIGAIQQIKKEKDTEVKAVQDDNADLRSKLAAQDKRLTELEAKDQARDAKMASIEKLLESPDQPATRTISLKQGE